LGGWSFKRIVAAWVLSGLLGGTMGMAAVPLAASLLGEMGPYDALGTAIIYAMIGSVLATPLALSGLGLVGFPLAFALERFAHYRSLPVVGFVLGGVLGGGFAHLVGLDLFGAGPFNLINFGSTVGAFTGMWWTILANPHINIWGGNASPESRPS
jgi:hypothetical protein